MHLFSKIFSAAVVPPAPRLCLSLCLLTTAFLQSVAAAAPAARLADPRAALEPRVVVGRSLAASPLLRHAQALGRLDAQTSLHAALVLPLRSQNQLSALLRRQYTPGDPLFHQFLKPQEFTARFSPTAADYEAVAAYARTQGLTVSGGSVSRTLLNVSGPSARIEAAFGVEMGKYRLSDGREVYANRTAPRLPRSVAARVAGIAGLNNLTLLRPLHRQKAHTAAETSLLYAAQWQSGAIQSKSAASSSADAEGTMPAVVSIGSGTLGGLTPNDIKYAYSLGGITPLYGTTSGTATLPSGTGQRIGLFELDSYTPADIATYVSTYGLPTILTGTSANVIPVVIPPYKGVIVSPGGQSEVTLDIDMVLALAPTASVYVYEDDQLIDATAALNIFDKMTTDVAADGTPLLQVISCSWGSAEDRSDPATVTGENTAFQRMAAQGQSLFCSSGDRGAYGDSSTVVVSDPSSQPYATGVGGTTLSYTKPATSAASGVYVSEKVWGDSADLSLSPFGSGGGGGVSSTWPKPNYQLGFGVSATRRDVPDVALNADPNTGYEIFVTGVDQVVGGTSAAAPLWASYIALVNQQRATNGLGTIGFLNPVIYPIGRSSAYVTEFHDVITGDNLFYDAGPGYDDATGFGSFIGDTLLTALSFNADQGTGTATITGIVSDSAAPTTVLTGVTVTAFNATTGKAVTSTTTDAGGSFTLTVPSGISLNLTADPSTNGGGAAYLSQTQSGISLTSGQSLAVNFALGATHTYASGLQMISAPFDYTGVGNFAALFGLSAAQASSSPRLIQWQPTSVGYVFYPTVPADTLRLGQGYWVRFPGSFSLILAGTPVTTQSYQIPLKAGWNQIGDPYTVSVTLSSATVLTADGTVEGALAASKLVQPTFFSYSSATNAYVALNASSGTLDPYVGYWAYASQPAILIVTAGVPPPPVP